MEEIWKAIEGYEGLYEVSNQGRVRTLTRTFYRCDGVPHTIKGAIRKPTITRFGYCRIKLTNDTSYKMVFVHRLVAEAFVHNDDPEHKITINHKNEIKTDNRAENLEWVTQKENNNHGTRNERASASLKGRTPFAAIECLRKVNSKPVIQYDMAGNEIAKFTSISEVEQKAGFNGSNIGACCRGVRKQAYGFIWKFA